MSPRAFVCILFGAFVGIPPTRATTGDPLDSIAGGERQRASSGPKFSQAATRLAEDENNDLDRIPNSARQPSSTKADHSPAASGSNQRIYVENAFILSAQRDAPIVPSPGPGASSWQDRLFLDVRNEWPLGRTLNLTFSDRLNLRVEADISFPNHENVINEFREGFLSWEPADRLYLDVGRINVKSGAALGFNPTDFFKTRAVVESLSADPSVLREDRLGTAMLQTQFVGQGRTLTVALAPPLASSSNTTRPSFNPSFDRTNDRTRLLLKGSIHLGSDFSPELLFYREGTQNRLGANITRGIGQQVVAYGEWAGGRRSSLGAEALRYGHQTGTFPPTLLDYLPADPSTRFQNDLSVGLSYATTNKMTFNLEYHYHQAGFSRQDWSNWFDTGKGQAGSSPIARELWYLRSYALAQQEPIARQGIFLRMDWANAFIPDLEITGFVNTDLNDGSSLVQVGALFYLSTAWTFGTQANANLGSKRSDFGSLPQAAGLFFKMIRYF